MKRTYRLVALLMAVLMLFGMLPASYAEGGNQMPGGEFTVGCNHNWDWRYPNGEPKHCQDERLMEMYCTLCGQVASSYTVTGDHTHGSWQWDYTPPANCCEWGIQNEVCSVCGEVFNEREVQGEHQWGGYTTVEPAGCETPGLEIKYCTVCGDRGDSREIPAKGHDWGDWRWEVEPSCNQEGLRVRYCKRCNMREEEYVKGGEHQWGGYTTVEPAGCETPGLESKLCTVCGEHGDSREIPALGHDWGDWRWEVEASCNQEGLRVRYCKRCNMREEEYVKGGEHQWGEWITTIEPTCMERGRHHHTCQRCGTTMWEYMPMVDHVFGEWRVVEEPQVGLPGYERRFCIYQCGTYEEREIPPLEEAISLPGLALTLVLSSTPANGTHFVVGEEVTFTETWVNNSDQTLYPFSVSIFTCAAPVYGSEVDQICSWYAEDYGGPVAPGATNSHTLTVTVTEADVARGAIYAQAELLSTVQDGPDLENVATPYVTAPCAPTAVGNSTGVRLEKELRNAPANGEYYVPGEVLNYALTLRIDDGLLLDDAAIYDPINGGDGLVISYGKGLYGGMGMDVFYTVTEEDAQRGYVENTAYASWLYSDSGEAGYCESETVTAPCGSNVPPVENIDALLEKYVMNVPANGEYFVPGETIEYAVIFMNVCPHDLHDVEVMDPLKGSNEDSVITREPVVEREGTLYLSFNYVVTEEDAERGYVENTASAFWLNPEIEEWSSCESNTVITETGYGESTDLGLTVTKTVTSTPANGSYYVPGETVTYELCVKNNGDPLNDLDVSDWMWGDEHAWVGSFATGEAVIYPVTHIVTEADARAKHVNNIAYATAIDKDGNQVAEYSNLVTVPCNFHDTDGDGEPDEPYGIHTWLDVTKEVESLPMNGQFYVEGETVSYKITYTNAGESVLMDVRIYDALVGMAEIATAEYMEPGDSRVCYLNYTVTAEDTQRGYITNTAIGQYVMHGYVNTFYSNEVTVQTNYFKNVIFTPDVTEDPGTIDPGKLPLGESSCVRTITGKDNASASYETTFCADHVATQSSVMLMTQAATTPEAQVQAATYAATLWRTEAEKLYQQLLDAADNQGKITVMTEYIRFAAMAANYEIVLKNIYPDQPALVAQLIAKLWEDKCVTLCYEIHTAADARTDSLLSVTAATGAAADCACTVTAETAGTKAYTQSFCAAHAFPFSMIDMLLQGQDTADSWATVRQIWMVELNGTYNKVNTLLAGNSDLALAEFNATMQWLEAREAYLNALYPDNPELVAQIMVKHIMDCVNDLCPALK